jgi:hypothetical protein
MTRPRRLAVTNVGFVARDPDPNIGPFDLTGFSWTRLIETISLERRPGQVNSHAPTNTISFTGVVLENGREVRDYLLRCIAEGHFILSVRATQDNELEFRAFERQRSIQADIDVDEELRKLREAIIKGMYPP